MLDSLLAQGAARVVLCLPRRYSRFPGPVTPPPLPRGVTLLWSDTDHGPATKLLPALRAFPQDALAYCDDDCHYQSGWLAALCATAGKGEAVAASGWSVDRLKRQGAAPPHSDIAQGFSGVLIRRGMIDPRAHDIPAEARPVDDIWLSGMRALTGTPLRLAPRARARVTPLDRPASLQDSTDRARANAAAAQWLWERYGLWPPRR
ncbi:hypothetical protein [Mameliella sp.]|uniref:hypothetical protein n=1 Tax=Mameliella sp. TaxID=1924940 RepID=UPI003BAB33EA